MKKNISINISGIIFHIEEDGYDRLKSYLESINQYFSTFEDSSEIVADIENRIAEIFFSKLTNGKQVITVEDIESLITTMGTIADFEAIEDPDDNQKSSKQEETKKENSSSESEQSKESGPKKLFRDVNRKVLGGVAAGVAHYFKIDPIWIRLILVLMFINVFFGELSGVVFVAYIVLWIVVPANDRLEEDKKIKKIYRNPDDKVLGGVASGIATYFGTDITVIRLLFVLSIFLGGSGLVLYIILWIITPEAKTITDKMQMQGEPVTLANIEQNVKKSLNVKEGEETGFIKVLLFPFRLISLVISALGKFLGPLFGFLVEAIRVVTGVLLFFIGFAITISILFVSLFGAGLFQNWGDYISTNSIPYDVLQATISPVVAIFLVLVIIIPAISLSLGGIALILKRKVVNSYVSWALFGLWIMSLVGLSFTAPAYIKGWAREGDYTESKTFDLQNKVAVLKVGGNWDKDNDYKAVTLKVRGHSDSLYVLDMRFEARGESRQDAIENAQTITYNVNQKDSIIIFDPNFIFKDDAVFRAQQLDMTLYVPFGAEFEMDKSLKNILNNTIYRDGYRLSDLENNRWVITENGLECLSCNTSSRNGKSNTSIDYSDFQSFDFDNFKYIKASSFYELEILQGENYSVKVDASNDNLDLIKAYQSDGEVVFEMKGKNIRWFDRNNKSRVKVFITMPTIENLDLSGACTAKVNGFTQQSLSANIAGASTAEVNGDIDRVSGSLSGTGTLKLWGTGRELDFNLSGASSLDAFQYQVDDAEIDISGASSAKLFVKDRLKGSASGISNVKYKGNAKVDMNISNSANVDRG